MPVIDTESHVVYRLWPIETNPGRSLTEPYTWHALSGDLLVQEMDRAGVDRAFLIGYDGFDMIPYLDQFGSSPDDVHSGRQYARFFARKYPDRFVYFTTLRDPRAPGALKALEAETADGVTGIKIFPSYLEIALDDDAMMAVYRLCEERNLRVIFGLEDTQPPRTCTFGEYWGQMDRVLEACPQLLVQFNHAGAAPLPSAEADGFFGLVRRWDRVYVSTAFLGLDWPDEWRYPFPAYLSRLKVVYDAIGGERLMWGTDWPWLESFAKYPQLIDAIRDHADFLSPQEKAAYLGGTAERFLKGE